MPVYQGKGPEEYAQYVEAYFSAGERKLFETALAIAHDARRAGGRVFIVGGAVRDEILGTPSDDYELEFYGMDPQDVQRIAARYGRAKAAGRSFAVLNLMLPTGRHLDLTFPRRDSQVGEKHTDVEVHVDPNLSLKEAARRRDFTIGAMLKDPFSGEIYDPFGGREDAHKRLLRAVDPVRFADDPLRPMRGVQFVSRFGLRVDPATRQLMESMVPKLETLSRERTGGEWAKLLKSSRPSIGLQLMFDLGIIQRLYPELAALKETSQEIEWHPEGDVWTHTLMVVDAAALLVRRERLDAETARIVMWAALAHDLGKPATTAREDGRVRSKGHEEAGEEPARAFLERLGADKLLAQKVIALVKDHLWPVMQFMAERDGTPVTDAEIRRLAKRLAPATIEELTWVAQADHAGRGPFPDPREIDQYLLPEPYEAGHWLRERARTIGVGREKPRPLLLGRDLLALGFPPGEKIGVVLKLADECRDRVDATREDALAAMKGANTLDDAADALRTLLPPDASVRH